MTTKDAIIHAVEDLPPEYLDEVAGYLQALKLRAAHQKRAYSACQRVGFGSGLAPPRGGRSMARFVKGDVVVLPFPFSDLSDMKRRPALVLADAGGNALLLCQITSQVIRDEYAIKLEAADFQSGSLAKSSFIRPNRIFTADERIAVYRAGQVKQATLENVVTNFIKLLEK